MKTQDSKLRGAHPFLDDNLHRAAEDPGARVSLLTPLFLDVALRLPSGEGLAKEEQQWGIGMQLHKRISEGKQICFRGSKL